MRTLVSQGMFDVINRINWDVFGTNTFKAVKPVPVLFQYQWDFFHALARTYQLPYRELLIALRFERGEIGGRPHFHYLLGQPKALNNRSLAHVAIATWKSLMDDARTSCRPYLPCGSAAQYLMKDVGWNPAVANDYETRKFDLADDAVLSSAVHRCLAVSRRISERRLRAAQRNACHYSTPVEIKPVHTGVVMMPVSQCNN